MSMCVRLALNAFAVFFVTRRIDATAIGAWPPPIDVINRATEILHADCGNACVEVLYVL